VDDQGHERAKAFDRKTDAQTWLDNEVTAKLATGTYVAPRAGLVTVAAVDELWSASQGHVAAKTAATRKSAWNSRVKPRWEHVAVADVKTVAVRAWVSKMVTDEVGTPTIENAFGLLRQLLGAAVEDARIARNPCEGVKLPKRQHADRGYLSHAQVAALADAVDRQPEVVRFLAYTGLRWGEMAALRVCDFDMLRRRVNVSRSVTESGGLVWSTPKTWERRSVLMVGKAREDLVFTNQRGGVLRNSNWRAGVPARCGEVPEDRRHLPIDHPARLEAYRRKPVRQCWCQRQGLATHARACESVDDVGRLRGPVRRRLRWRSGKPRRGYQVYCGPAADWQVWDTVVS
jgi:integrase